MTQALTAFNFIPIASPDQINLEALPYRYPMRTAVTHQAEIRQIETCMARGYPRIQIGKLRDDWVSIVGFGPSLTETWTEITQPCITVGGAHDFLIEQGIIPTWHAECDGREHKTKHLEHPHPDVTYLMATICNPRMWDQLQGQKVLTWHNANGKHVVDWIGANDPGGVLLAGGSVIGLTAIHLGGFLGFRRFRLFGFDGNFRGEIRHAGPHYGPLQKRIERRVGSRSWPTTPQMSNACDELVWLLRYAPIQVEIYGDCLQAAVVAEWKQTVPLWTTLLQPGDPSWTEELRRDFAYAEGLRDKAQFKTGSISPEAGLLLRAICEHFRPETIVEIGTFLGKSTLAMRARHIYTCDQNNDCLPSREGITCHPYTTSTEMLGGLADRVRADLFFFDGRIAVPDLASILRMSHPSTVYVFDDFEREEKGVANVRMLGPFLADHVLLEPPLYLRGKCSLALLVPRARL